MAITIVTDGSADNRTKKGGWAAIVRSSSLLIELTGWDDEATSNRMELLAAINGLKSIYEPSEVTVITDSAYLLNAMKNRWYERWIMEDYFDVRTRPNLDLWNQLSGLAKYHNITWEKIKGHSGDYWNERADKLADMARRQKLSVRNEVPAWDSTRRCDSVSPAGRQCKLHNSHSGSCHWTNGKSNGVAPYGTES